MARPNPGAVESEVYLYYIIATSHLNIAVNSVRTVL